MLAAWRALTLGAKIRRAHTIFWWAIVFPTVILCLAWTTVTRTLHAQAIMRDHSIIGATISADTHSAASPQLIKLKYSFTLANKTYDGKLASLKSDGINIRPDDSMQVAYANTDPSQSQPVRLIEQNADLQASLRKLASTALLGALLVALCWWLLSILVRNLTAHLS